MAYQYPLRGYLLVKCSAVDDVHPIIEALVGVLAECLPYLYKFTHVLLDFYEDSGLTDEQFKDVGALLVDEFVKEPRLYNSAEQQPALAEFRGKLKRHLLEIARDISFVTHEDVKVRSTAFMNEFADLNNPEFEKALLIKTRALSHLLLIMHVMGQREGQTEAEFQAQCLTDMDGLLGEVV